MKITDSNVIRFHLQVVYGISVKSLERRKEWLLVGGTKVFGVPLENLPRCYMPDFGLVPCFLVDACSFVLERAGTVGLFRKPGSLPRMKTLRARLNRGEVCLSTAISFDVATLIKQFCRELPEPLFPPELHAALLKAQALPGPRDRTAALQLLSCLLPARNSSCLHYLFDFLCKVSRRCSENLMTSSNLATVFVPCLLPPPNTGEMSEGRLELRVLVLRTFIENPHLFGVIPKVVMDSMDFLLHTNPLRDARSKRKKHSFKVMRSVKTVSWMQGRSKVRLSIPECRPPEERRTLRRSLGLDVFPNVQLFRTCTPCEEEGSAESSTPVVKEKWKMSQERWKRELRFSDGGSKLPPWKRRTSNYF